MPTRSAIPEHSKRGAVAGPGGGVFMAVQHWLNGRVSADYDGVTMGEDHLAKVVSGAAVAKAALTARDAATRQFATPA